MSTFGSSVINKSSKKIAPKAAAPRRRPAVPATVERASSSRTTTPPPALNGPSLASLAAAASAASETAGAESHTVPVVVIEEADPTPASNAVPIESPPTPLNQEPSKTGNSNRPSVGQQSAGRRDGPRTRATAHAASGTSSESEVQGDGPLPATEPIDVVLSTEPPTKRRRVAPPPDPSHPTSTGAQSTGAGGPPSTRTRGGRFHAPVATVTFEAHAPSVETTPAVMSRQAEPEAGPSTLTSQPKRKTKAKAKGKGKAVAVPEPTSVGMNVAPATDPAPTTPVRRRRKRREPTPENAETVEIAPGLVKMADLCRDLRTGKKSKREEELQALDWTAVIRRQRERKARRERGELPPSESVDQMLARVEREQAPVRQSLAAPQMRVVNGKIVVDGQSLQVDRHARAAEATQEMEEIVENDLTRRVTSGSWMKRAKKEPWDEEATALFYQGLRMFGTDFQIISRMVPGKSRRHIKNKFVKEERLRPERINEALTGPKAPMDLEEYSRRTQTQYDEVATFDAELAAEAAQHAAAEARLEAEAQASQREQRAEVDNAIPSIENGGVGIVTGGASSAKENEVPGPSAAGKKKPASRKPAAATAISRKKKAKPKPQSRHDGGEQIEVLGTIEDVQVERAAAQA
ncbi:MAG: Transcription factor TFIIIB component B [Thelocarpon superellum]|nr:MAG: Transcription factor TFIIIB component B [Thelocarpon superellum]